MRSTYLPFPRRNRSFHVSDVHSSTLARRWRDIYSCPRHEGARKDRSKLGQLRLVPDSRLFPSPLRRQPTRLPDERVCSAVCSPVVYVNTIDVNLQSGAPSLVVALSQKPLLFGFKSEGGVWFSLDLRCALTLSVMSRGCGVPRSMLIANVHTNAHTHHAHTHRAFTCMHARTRRDTHSAEFSQGRSAAAGRAQRTFVCHLLD